MSNTINSGTLTTFARSSQAVRRRSIDLLDAHNHVVCKAAETAIPLRVIAPTLPQNDSIPVSRLELLLTPRTLKATFTPEDDTSKSQEVNKAIEMSSQWTEVRDAILDVPVLTASNLAFALYRLGCISAYASKKRRKDLQASQLVPQIFDLAMSKFNIMEPASLVLLFDGCARLHHTPSTSNLTKISQFVTQKATSFDARQLPLVFWAFSTFFFQPGEQTLVALEDAVNSRASELSPQGVALVLRGFHFAQYGLSQLTIDLLSDIIQRQVFLFRPSELATCLKALAAMGHTPTHAFVQAIAGSTRQAENLQPREACCSETGPRLSLAL